MSDRDAALNAWREVLGPEHVITEPEALRRAETATFATRARIPVLLRPADAEQTAACLRIASAHGQPLHPVSRGRNWGYGSRAPVGDGCALLDLGRMNRIVDFSEEMAYITVEPGVTQGDVAVFLRQRGSRLMLSVTGAPADASLIGNALERGLGKGVLGERFAHVCGLETLLADGRRLRTGFSRFPGAHVAPLSRWGLGPSLDGLFSQSSLGVVTRMTLWLTPYPAHLQTFFYQAADNAALGPLVDALRDLRLSGVLRGSFVLFNDLRVLSLKQSFPWAEADAGKPLDEGIRRRLARGAGGGRWFGEGALLSPSAGVGRAERKLVRRALQGKADKLLFVDAARARWLKRLAPLLRRFLGVDLGAMMDMAYDKNPQRGIPIPQATLLAYWKKHDWPGERATDLDPDRDRCGLMWYAPVLPFSGRHVTRALALIEEILAAHGFDANLGLNFSSERTVEATVAILFDREGAGEDQRAQACHDDLLARLLAAGYPPYRLGLQSMNALPAGTDDTAAVLAQLKAALDPAGILAPGRYPG